MSSSLLLSKLGLSQCLSGHVGNKLLCFAAEPRLPGDAGEREAQQGATSGGEAPLDPDLLHPAAEEVLNGMCFFLFCFFF